MFPKDKPARNPSYLTFIREQSCQMCGYAPTDSYKYLMHAHHTETGGISSKGSDYSAVPLCFACHRKVHDKYGKRGPWSEEELISIIAKLINRYKGIK